MSTILDTLGAVIVAALVVWFVVSWLLRLAAISCWVCAAGLLAIGDEPSAVGVAGCGCVCWAATQLLHRIRRGRWRSPALTRVLGSRRVPGPSSHGAGHRRPSTPSPS
jgi:hypothetical protein